MKFSTDFKFRSDLRIKDPELSEESESVVSFTGTQGSARKKRETLKV